MSDTEIIQNFADKIRNLSIEARTQNKKDESYIIWRQNKTISDINKFFEDEVKKGAMKKIEKRANNGAVNCNILEYGFYENFYLNNKGEVVRVPNFEKKDGCYMHRIHHIVFTEHFQKILNDFINSLGSIKVSCWYPGKNINVIEVYWGPTKVHKWDDNDDGEIVSPKSVFDI